MPECARAELAPSLEPGDDRIVGQGPGDDGGDVIGLGVTDRRRVQPRSQLVVGPRPTERGGGHRLDGVAERVGDVQGRAERGAGVAAGGLHPDVGERTCPRPTDCWPRS